MALDHLPAKIEKITVRLDEDELGVLTHGFVHHYQPIQTPRHVSLTMTKPNLDGYSSGALHLFSRRICPKASIAGSLLKNWQDMPESMTCICSHCRANTA
ncbi:hypothetical protein Q4491_10715 [Photobacterium sp. 2_MG-2023]|uniref:hypothetical protein n=1 Tax=Photobacterium sp. 2_MG-2023 TaxID=3062663 RepID=UPI0026E3D519|nr:hypothetical protein [Photobacterium sp. 2_MG-2023]MDO6581817.1 hypothetical protein [Photobacterium sp. 2_MG-2023]